MSESGITVKEAAKKANTDPAYIRQMILAGKIKASKFGMMWVVDPDSLDKWHAERPKSRGGARTRKK